MVRKERRLDQPKKEKVRPLHKPTARVIAAYILDRADQYKDNSPYWVVLADIAKNIMLGEAQAALAHGELDESLFKRIAAFENQTSEANRRVDAGNILRQQRIEADITMGQMATAIGVSVAQISDWELGKSSPTETQERAMETVRSLVRNA